MLLCTDGFWEYITETYMLKYLRKANSVREWIFYMKNIFKRQEETRTEITALLLAYGLIGRNYGDSKM